VYLLYSIFCFVLLSIHVLILCLIDPLCRGNGFPFEAAECIAGCSSRRLHNVRGKINDLAAFRKTVDDDPKKSQTQTVRRSCHVVALTLVKTILSVAARRRCVSAVLLN